MRSTSTGASACGRSTSTGSFLTAWHGFAGSCPSRPQIVAKEVAARRGRCVRAELSAAALLEVECVGVVFADEHLRSVPATFAPPDHPPLLAVSDPLLHAHRIASS